MENINEENPYEIYSKTVDRLNITMANIDTLILIASSAGLNR